MSLAEDRKRDYNRERYRRMAEKRREAEGALKECPECGDLKWNAETLRVHRWLAHDVRQTPNGSVPPVKPVKGRPRSS